MSGPQFLERISIIEDRVSSFDAWPFSLPFVRELALEFKSTVTFFVGENGSGKSTLLEAIAQRCGLPVSGGGKTETAGHHGPDDGSTLAPALRASFIKRPRACSALLNVKGLYFVNTSRHYARDEPKEARLSK